MNGIDELLQRYWAGIVFVEYLKDAIREERLQTLNTRTFWIISKHRLWCDQSTANLHFSMWQFFWNPHDGSPSRCPPFCGTVAQAVPTNSYRIPSEVWNEITQHSIERMRTRKETHTQSKCQLIYIHQSFELANGKRSFAWFIVFGREWLSEKLNNKLYPKQCRVSGAKLIRNLKKLIKMSLITSTRTMNAYYNVSMALAIEFCADQVSNAVSRPSTRRTLWIYRVDSTQVRINLQIFARSFIFAVFASKSDRIESGAENVDLAIIWNFTTRIKTGGQATAVSESNAVEAIIQLDVDNVNILNINCFSNILYSRQYWNKYRTEYHTLPSYIATAKSLRID